MAEPNTFARPREGETFEEFQARYRASIPPVLYVPLAKAADDGGDLQVQLRTTNEGKTALLLYSALDRMLDCCGPHQPYSVLPTASLDEVASAHPFDVVLFDLPIPEELRHPAPEASTRAPVTGATGRAAGGSRSPL